MNNIQALGKALIEFPQAELVTEHYFADGMYARSLFREKGTVIVGKVHKKEHFYIVASGAIRVTDGEGARDIIGPSIVVSKPGTQRAVLALEDSLCITVHRTDLKDLDEIEKEVVEPCDFALFNEKNERFLK
jgi:signal-transduction protein with cAMP-binding, CBS, and nucleotidyltransferase domain